MREQFATALVTGGGLFGQRLHDYVVQSGMNGGIDIARCGRLFIHNFINDGGDVLSGKWFFASDHFAEHHAERKDVAASVDHFALNLFWRHVIAATDDDSGLLYVAEWQDFCGTEAAT